MSDSCGPAAIVATIRIAQERRRRVMREPEIENARITRTWLGIEDHGILTAWIHLEYDGSAQSFGGYQLWKPDRAGWFVRRVLDILELPSWESLEHHNLRALHDHSKVHAIGHFLKDQWFNPGEELEASKDE